ncbi:hypothetical protein B0H13DRAFT_2336049 [Mycena leptocephala]|nr:hypothetical protein B0H13DRAFT_2336049 [Mycena leptocephala]
MSRLEAALCVLCALDVLRHHAQVPLGRYQVLPHRGGQSHCRLVAQAVRDIVHGSNAYDPLLIILLLLTEINSYRSPIALPPPLPAFYALIGRALAQTPNIHHLILLIPDPHYCCLALEGTFLNRHRQIGYLQLGAPAEGSFFPGSVSGSQHPPVALPKLEYLVANTSACVAPLIQRASLRTAVITSCLSCGHRAAPNRHKMQMFRGLSRPGGSTRHTAPGPLPHSPSSRKVGDPVIGW